MITCRVLLSLSIIAAPLAAATCDSLAGLKLADTTITSAATVAAGAFTLPVSLPSFKKLPAFCRVQGVIQPSSDSHIEFEVWMPSSGWNGKFHGEGNGGFAGSIDYSALAASVLSGYASSSTDTGHRGGATDASWALGHPEKIVDFGYRAIHETAEKSKAVVRAFYGDSARHSYFSSCSNGGRQALMEAQRYPADYDGIIAGAPAASFTRIVASFTWDLQALETDPASYIPTNKYPAIEAAAVAACDARDGVKDGVIDDPTKCGFKPATLLCNGPESAACLTQPQITALEKIYAGPRNSQGQQLYPGFMPGGESGAGMGWAAWISGAAPHKSLQYAFATQGGANLIYQNAAWDFRAYNLDHDVKVADDTMGQRLNAVDPNLKALKDRGGKLILYHGWSDPALAPMATVNYYQSVVAKMGQKDTADFVRLYMVPGMQHCSFGPGPDSFGALPGGPQADTEHSMSVALERWVEKGPAPAQIVASKYAAERVVRSRPLCPYPQIARYSGSGSTDDAANFSCVAP
jgi:Tannase and feruloyl esterase